MFPSKKILIIAFASIATVVTAHAADFEFGATMEIFYNFKEGRTTIEPEIRNNFGNNQAAELIPLLPGA